jgi:two-component system sensor kinase FixL
MGRPAYDFFHPDDEQAMKRRMIPAVYQHGVRTFRYRSRHKNGRYFWLESTHRSIRDPESHELVEIIAVTRDITPQVNAEGASQRLAQVVEASSDLVMFCDSNLAVNYMNSSALAGFNLADCQGQSLKGLLSEKSYRRLREQVLPKASEDGAWRGGLHLKSEAFGERFMVLREVMVRRAKI